MACIAVVYFVKQKTAYEMRISDWSSDVCSSDLGPARDILPHARERLVDRRPFDIAGGDPGLRARIVDRRGDDRAARDVANEALFAWIGGLVTARGVAVEQVVRLRRPADELRRPIGGGPHGTAAVAISQMSGASGLGRTPLARRDQAVIGAEQRVE